MKRPGRTCRRSSSRSLSPTTLEPPPPGDLFGGGGGQVATATPNEVGTTNSEIHRTKCSSCLLRFQEVLPQPAFKDIVSWSPSAESDVVHDRKALTDLVFPQCSKATLYASFERQLNMYAFNKGGPNSWCVACHHVARVLMGGLGRWVCDWGYGCVDG